MARLVAKLRISLSMIVIIAVVGSCASDTNQPSMATLESPADFSSTPTAPAAEPTPTSAPTATVQPNPARLDPSSPNIVPPVITTPVPTAASAPSVSPTVVSIDDDEPDADEDDDRPDFEFEWPFDPNSFPFPDIPDFPIFPTVTSPGNEEQQAAEYTRYEIPEGIAAEISGPSWQPRMLVQPDFIAGHVVMDYVSTAYLDKYLDSTIDAMNDTGSDWVFYDQYATYYSVTPPEIDLVESIWSYGFRSLSPAEITKFSDEVHESGSKFGLILELNYDGLLSDRANPFSDASMSQAESAELHIAEQADLAAINDPAALNFWDQWFEEYQDFVLSHALLAESVGIDMLVIGKQLGAPTREINTQRWRDLIAEVRSVYSGLISYAQWVDENQGPHFEFPFDAVDYPMIYNWGKLSNDQNPTIDELESSIRESNEAIYKQLSDSIGKPIIFVAPYQSRAGAAEQVWFEPSVAQPTINTDRIGQAAMYQALFRAVSDQRWVAGVVSWGFWWRDDFTNIFAENDASFDKSSSIRNKPSVEIWRRWLGR